MSDLKLCPIPGCGNQAYSWDEDCKCSSPSCPLNACVVPIAVWQALPRQADVQAVITEMREWAVWVDEEDVVTTPNMLTRWAKRLEPLIGDPEKSALDDYGTLPGIIRRMKGHLDEWYKEKDQEHLRDALSYMVEGLELIQKGDPDGYQV